MNDNGYAIRPELEEELKRLVAQGQRIAVIKQYREATGCGLTHAKRWLDQYLTTFVAPIWSRAPCPYCGQPLRTPKARQCVDCGMDWHDPSHVVKRGNGNRLGLVQDSTYVIELCQRSDGTRFTKYRDYSSGMLDPDHAFETGPARGSEFVEWTIKKRRDHLQLTKGERFGVDSNGAWLTEGEWAACIDPKQMLRFVQEIASERKLRLFAVACLGQVSHLLTDDKSQKAFEVLERFADGGAEDELPRATADARIAYYEAEYAGDEPRHFAGIGLYRALIASAKFAAMEAHHWALCAKTAASSVESTTTAMHVQFLRDIFGNPFRPTAIECDCATPAVLALAETIDDERAFDRLPELADALASAGCGNETILAHCRSSGPHVRGCWVIDSVLGGE